jgi:alkanesulfonate monooxygenase SsuD/methylene tetrahydromethanopterin reductase-like flavin-dependent oxidoreductase (luciferase family)
MRFGLAIMNDFPPGTVPGERIALLREQVDAARAAGIESIFVLQHYLGNMPTLQPIPLLAALASGARGMTLGTNMFILPLRHPVAVAEEFATLDHLTGGRTVAGFGLGYRENEFESFGVGMAERVSRYEESVRIIRDLWRGEPVTVEGKHYSLRDQRISLPPVRPGGPPIWVGAGSHRTGATRAAALGDGWIMAPHTAPDRARRLIGHYRDERARLGRAGPGELVLRRELVLDEDPDRARAIGLAARNSLTRQYAAYNAPDGTGTYRHLRDEASALDVADESYLFTDPATAVTKLRQVAKLGVDHVLLRAQWYDLSQHQVLATLRLFGDHVRPALS